MIAANTVTSKEYSYERTDYGLIAEDILALTAEDWLELGRLCEQNAESKNITENSVENNYYAAQIIKHIASTKIKSEMNNVTPRLNIDGFEVNNVELAMAASHPIEFTWYTSISVAADDMADAIYTDNSNWYNGNGDAFRHVSWSALLYCKFYDENDFSQTDAEERTYAWTNAHEGYTESESPSPFDETLSLETRMDLYNNRMGILLAEIRTDMNDYDEDTIFERAEVWIDNGDAKRIDAVNGVDQLVATTNTEKRS